MDGLLSKIKAHFVIMQDMEDEQEIVKQITSGVSFRGANLWVLIFAIFIASLGLNVNSTAVIIGAMLISPLMGPIIGMGLAMGINDLELMRRAVKNFGVATLISVLTAMVYFLITPLGEAQSELLARTSPTIYDVLIATFGGAAGILALCTKGKGNVIPGVAIATALMPPLCTAGYGLATGHFLYFLGAFYLFFINTVFISLATYVGVRLMHFHRLEFKNQAVAKKTQRMVMAIAIVTMIPATFMTIGIVRRSIFDNKVNSFVKVELSQPGTQVISSNVDEDNQVLSIVAVGKEISDSAKSAAKKRMEQYGLGKYTLNIIQGEGSDSILSLSNKLTQINNSRNDERKKLVEMSAEIGELNSRLDSYTKYETLTQEVCSEMKALYPQVKAVSISRVAQSSRDTTAVKRFVAAIISLDAKARISPADKTKLHDWLQARIKADSLV
ncbi:MAG: DUF389 domain-containing protein, partial [Prevotella sp.]